MQCADISEAQSGIMMEAQEESLADILCVILLGREAVEWR